MVATVTLSGTTVVLGFMASVVGQGPALFDRGFDATLVVAADIALVPVRGDLFASGHDRTPKVASLGIQAE
jgi:hypothetical protein